MPSVHACDSIALVYTWYSVSMYQYITACTVFREKVNDLACQTGHAGSETSSVLKEPSALQRRPPRWHGLMTGWGSDAGDISAVLTLRKRTRKDIQPYVYMASESFELLGGDVTGYGKIRVWSLLEVCLGGYQPEKCVPATSGETQNRPHEHHQLSVWEWNLNFTRVYCKAPWLLTARYFSIRTITSLYILWKTPSGR